jgi:hypothetical protein
MSTLVCEDIEALSDVPAFDVRCADIFGFPLLPKICEKSRYYVSFQVNDSFNILLSVKRIFKDYGIDVNMPIVDQDAKGCAIAFITGEVQKSNIKEAIKAAQEKSLAPQDIKASIIPVAMPL